MLFNSSFRVQVESRVSKDSDTLWNVLLKHVRTKRGEVKYRSTAGLRARDPPCCLFSYSAAFIKCAICSILSEAQVVLQKMPSISIFTSSLRLLGPTIHFCVCFCINSFIGALLCTLCDGKMFVCIFLPLSHLLRIFSAFSVIKHWSHWI